MTSLANNKIFVFLDSNRKLASIVSVALFPSDGSTVTSRVFVPIEPTAASLDSCSRAVKLAGSKIRVFVSVSCTAEFTGIVGVQNEEVIIVSDGSRFVVDDSVPLRNTELCEMAKEPDDLVVLATKMFKLLCSASVEDSELTVVDSKSWVTSETELRVVHTSCGLNLDVTDAASALKNLDDDPINTVEEAVKELLVPMSENEKDQNAASFACFRLYCNSPDTLGNHTFVFEVTL